MQSAIHVRPGYEHMLVVMPVQPAPQVVEQPTLVEAALALRQQLVDMIVAGLRAPTGEAWFEHWDTSDHLEQFDKLFYALIAVTRAVGISPDVEARQQVEVQQKVERHFADATEELRFLEATIERALRMVRSITSVTVVSQLQRDDAACAQRFNLAARWYTLASTTLQVIADEEEPAPRPLEPARGVVESIFGALRFAALEAHHAAMEGARLRAADPPAIERQAIRLEDFPEDFEELELKIQSIERP